MVDNRVTTIAGNGVIANNQSYYNWQKTGSISHCGAIWANDRKQNIYVMDGGNSRKDSGKKSGSKLLILVRQNVCSSR